MSRIEMIVNATENNCVKIAVHNGKFHTDEIMALVWLSLAGIEYEVIRTRDPKEFESADLVFDLGGKNEGKYFDHHQREFDKTHTNGIKMAACGLVWEDLSEKILDNILPEGASINVRKLVRTKIEERLVVPTDTSDNGLTGAMNPLSPLSLTEIVNAMNSPVHEEQEAAFTNALSFVRSVVLSMIKSWINVATEDDRIYNEILSQEGCSVLVLDKPGPWIQAVLNHWEESLGFKVCIFPDLSAKEESWRIQTFPGSKDNSFEMRCPAPKKIRGLKEGQFSYEFSNMTFVHPTGFIGGVRGNVNEALVTANAWVQQATGRVVI